MWTAEQEAEMRARYAAGDSFDEMRGPISRLGPPKSRNACIGKATRLVERGKLEPRGDLVGKENARRRCPPTSRQPSPAQRRAWSVAKPPNNHDDTPRPPKTKADMAGGETPATARPWLTRKKGECRWPLGEPSADMLMCCARAGHGPDGDYCEPHHRRGWHGA